MYINMHTHAHAHAHTHMHMYMYRYMYHHPVKTAATSTTTYRQLAYRKILAYTVPTCMMYYVELLVHVPGEREVAVWHTPHSQ